MIPSLTAAIIVLASASSFVYFAQNLIQAESDQESIGITLRAGKELMEGLLEAETGQLGFLISGKDEYLETFKSGREMAEASLSKLQMQFIDNPILLRRLDALQELKVKKFADLDKAIALRQNSSFDAAQAVIAAEEGKQSMDKMRSIMRYILFVERTHRTQINKTISEALFKSTISFIILAVLVSIVVTVGYRVTNREISARIQAEERLEKAKIAAEVSNQAKSVFLSNMSHEIRTPMNAILGYAQILKREKGLSETVSNGLNVIETSGNHLLRLINDILDISKIEAGRMELSAFDFDLQNMVKEISNLFWIRCEEKGLSWKVDIFTDAAIPVYGDETKLKQSLINILGNAVKFTDTGSVSLKISRSGDNLYQFEVSDTGKGVPKEAQKSIFEPFHQDAEGRAKGGTGLGLAISRKQIELMDGKLHLDSEPGKGAHFFFTLMLPPSKGEMATQILSGPQIIHLAKGAHVKAVVADDAKLNRDILAKILGDIGIEVLVAENGKEAVELVQKHNPDIVFMDMRMPVMNGIEATQIIKKKFGQKVKITAITASAFEHQRKIIEDTGCDDFISKPFRIDRVFDSLARLLNVGFEYEEHLGQTVSLDLDFSGIIIPNEIFTQIKDAATLSQITTTEQLLDDLENIDGVEPLVKQLKICLRRYDMEEFVNILEKCHHV